MTKGENTILQELFQEAKGKQNQDAQNDGQPESLAALLSRENKDTVAYQELFDQYLNC